MPVMRKYLPEKFAVKMSCYLKSILIWILWSESGRIPVKTEQRGQVAQVADIAEVTKGIQEPVTDLALVNGATRRCHRSQSRGLIIESIHGHSRLAKY